MCLHTWHAVCIAMQSHAALVMAMLGSVGGMVPHTGL